MTASGRHSTCHRACTTRMQEWLATEKRVVVIHRLHQILEPFMLRRQVQDVESRLPEKVPAPPNRGGQPHVCCIAHSTERLVNARIFTRQIGRVNS